MKLMKVSDVMRWISWWIQCVLNVWQWQQHIMSYMNTIFRRHKNRNILVLSHDDEITREKGKRECQYKSGTHHFITAIRLRKLRAIDRKQKVPKIDIIARKKNVYRIRGQIVHIRWNRPTDQSTTTTTMTKATISLIDVKFAYFNWHT